MTNENQLHHVFFWLLDSFLNQSSEERKGLKVPVGSSVRPDSPRHSCRPSRYKLLRLLQSLIVAHQVVARTAESCLR